MFPRKYCSDESESRLVRENQAKEFPSDVKFYIARRNDSHMQFMPSTELQCGGGREATG